jgi:hypothetical protein
LPNFSGLILWTSLKGRKLKWEGAREGKEKMEGEEENNEGKKVLGEVQL